MPLQFKDMIVSIFMATNTVIAAPAINMDNIDNLKEMACLSQAVHGEAGNQSMKGKIAVAYVILNRTKDEDFPQGVCEVIRQKGQFHFLKHVKKINENLIADRIQMAEVVKASWLAMNGKVSDPTRGALYFINPKKCTDPSWSNKYKRIVKIDDHVFYIRKV